MIAYRRAYAFAAIIFADVCRVVTYRMSPEQPRLLTLHGSAQQAPRYC